MNSNLRAYAVTAVLAILAGAGVAYCQHQGDAPAVPAECAGVAWAAPTAAKTKDTRRTGTTPRKVRKQPHATPSSAAPSPRHRRHVDIDLELDGC